MGSAEASSGEIIHYGATEIFDGVVINMQTMYMSWLTMAVVAIIVFAATRNPKIIPSGIQNVVEVFIDWLNGLMDSNIGIEGRRTMAPFIITLFLFLFVGNEIGLLPQVGAHFTSPTNDINVTLGMAITVSLTVYTIGVLKNGLGYFKHFIQPSFLFLPLNILEELSKPLTMALRLFGNILAGEILLIVLYMLAPWVIPDLWVGFSLIVGFLQAFIFTMLTMTAIAPVFRTHH
ncbi:MAG TPA: F0F1 ATP synthase subunit A [Candidatus Avacidaminococcus intestinavium]|uniref:ATP synthase subunit a n=1 Tax=Candidatus Avacidaminococcus intestinavium TaxID=2840684 RepID=A0A9D1MR40_9FIRM|nr:F0F1 ATP synthase subunit A [Candidatus Avacidaminococcus intestinavium]